MLRLVTDGYKILASNDGAIFEPKLEDIHQSVLNNTFDEADHPNLSMQIAHHQIYKDIPGGRMKCLGKSKKCVSCK